MAASSSSLTIRSEQHGEQPPPYECITRNVFSYRRHIKQKEEDIAICVCEYNADDLDSACGERCLNVLTSTECTPGYCFCGILCKNQKFQKCEYAMLSLFKTEGRGWGILAEENIKAGQFVIEYCGEVISKKEAKRRAQAYEEAGLKDAFIISLDASGSIDATRKGSLARFINHSCQPNCETRKWNVLGEVRVGIFAKQDILAGTELVYDYNFEWYGGDKVRCLCGATCCSGFLGAKSRGFQEDTYLWEDDDDRYSVEDIPLYDSEDDEPTSKVQKATVTEKYDTIAEREIVDAVGTDGVGAIVLSEPKLLSIQAPTSTTMEKNGQSFNRQELKKKSTKKLHMGSKHSSNNPKSTNPKPNAKTNNPKPHNSNKKSKGTGREQLNVGLICERLSSKEARDELLSLEQARNAASARLSSVHKEIRPAIEKHEMGSQGSVSTADAEKWIAADCSRLKAELDLFASVIKNVAFTTQRAHGDVATKAEGSVKDNERLPIFRKILMTG